MHFAFKFSLPMSLLSFLVVCVCFYPHISRCVCFSHRMWLWVSIFYTSAAFAIESSISLSLICIYLEILEVPLHLTKSLVCNLCSCLFVCLYAFWRCSGTCVSVSMCAVYEDMWVCAVAYYYNCFSCAFKSRVSFIELNLRSQTSHSLSLSLF